jgi:hypothetical protein
LGSTAENGTGTGAGAEAGTRTGTVSGTAENGTDAGTSANGTTGGIQVNVVKEASDVEAGLLIVSVPSNVRAALGRFAFPLPPQVIAGAAADAPITVTTQDGSPLPPWLNFDVATRTFTADKVPAGSFPMRVVVRIGARTYGVEIVETN